MRLLFGAYEPDQPPFLSEGLQIATNTYAGAMGYRPVGLFQPVSSPLSSEPLGAAAFGSSVLSGTKSNLYQLSGSSWSQIGSGYSASGWSFVQFGSIALATNGTDPMQKVDLTTFAVTALGGSPPTATMLTVVKDFVLAGSVAGVKNMIQWSGINNAEFWTAGLEQCDFQILATGGDVTGLFGGEYGIVLQRSRVSRMTYVGSNLVFQFDEISNNIGCVSPNSVIQAGNFGFFLSDTGFIMWDGASLKPIGQNRVNRYFSSLYSEADLVNMSAAIDLKNTLVAWTLPERTFIYNWVLDRWSIIEQPASFSFSGNANGDPVFYVFDDTFTLGAFSGGPMEAIWQMASVELIPGREARIESVRPITDAEDGITVSIAAMSRLSDAIIDNDYVEIEDSGDMAVRECGRYLRITQRIAPETDWTFALGIDLAAHAGVKR